MPVREGSSAEARYGDVMVDPVGETRVEPAGDTSRERGAMTEKWDDEPTLGEGRKGR